jgi:hypothetical protein
MCRRGLLLPYVLPFEQIHITLNLRITGAGATCSRDSAGARQCTRSLNTLSGLSGSATSTRASVTQNTVTNAPTITQNTVIGLPVTTDLNTLVATPTRTSATPGASVGYVLPWNTTAPYLLAFSSSADDDSDPPNFPGSNGATSTAASVLLLVVGVAVNFLS